MERMEKRLADVEMEIVTQNMEIVTQRMKIVTPRMKIVTQKDLLFGFCERYFNLGRGDFEVVSPEAGGY